MANSALIGSERHIMAGATRLGRAAAGERLEVSVILRPVGDTVAGRVARIAQGEAVAPLSRADFAAQCAAAPADMQAVEAFATAHHLTVVEAAPARRTIILSGTVARFEAAFGVELDAYEHESGTFRGRTGPVMLPPALHGVVQAVLGLDNRPAARAQFRRRHGETPATGHAPAQRAGAAPVSYTPLDLAGLYRFPAGTGAGEAIGIIELGGGTRAADLADYFKTLGLAAPKLVSVSVDQAKNAATGSADGPDGEVMLDVEVAGAIAPDATLVVYFAPNTDAGFLDAITTAIHDETHKPSVISISWGGPESTWTAQAFTAFDQAFADAASMGVTICIASGDSGSSDGTGADAVDFPASSPHALACGGTSLRANGQAIASESVWNDGAQGGAGGGGISTAFTTVPAWQAGLSAALSGGGTTPLRARGVPDVAGDADPQTGYQVRVDGTNTVIGGTSAVAPLWAGLIARINAARGTPVGFINPSLYGAPAALNDVTTGNNGTYAAAPGWDACTGLGSPNGSALAALFAKPAALS
jgi:kumamolisin